MRRRIVFPSVLVCPAGISVGHALCVPAFRSMQGFPSFAYIDVHASTLFGISCLPVEECRLAVHRHARGLMRFIPMLFFALISSVTLAAPADAPSLKFEGRDLFGLQVLRIRRSVPTVAPSHTRACPYDIMSDRARQSIWLIDVESGTQVPVVAGAGHTHRRAGHAMASDSPMSRRPMRAGRNCSCAGWKRDNRRGWRNSSMHRET